MDLKKDKKRKNQPNVMQESAMCCDRRLRIKDQIEISDVSAAAPWRVRSFERYWGGVEPNRMGKEPHVMWKETHIKWKKPIWCE